MKILVINTGSSSIKYVLYEMANNNVLANGSIERIGENQSNYKYSIFSEDIEKEFKKSLTIKDHKEGLRNIIEVITDPGNNLLKDPNEIEAIGHRVVHGGEFYSGAVLITENVKSVIKRLIPLAPLHNPSNLEGIEVAEHFFPSAKQVAVFDTAFHQTMPSKSYRYPIPNYLYENEQVRAYGMHGSSHSFVTKEALKLLDKEEKDTAIITIHLGNGCSMSAVKGGKCIDTSMGLSPLAGLMMGTRSGDIDPSIPFFLGTKMGMSFQEIDTLLNKESGLKGIAGSNDMRDVLEKRDKGDKKASLAIDMYVQRIKKYIGAYIAEMNALDALVFTAGIGENSSVIRELVCSELDFLGIEIDSSLNEMKIKGNQKINSNESKVQVWVIPTNEELEIALQTKKLIGN
ncbi:acetate/propionate family kinase [Aegicerativicinus sediminis]